MRVGRVTIDTQQVFTDGGGAFYRAVNRLHAQTRAAVIRRFLLFHEGDVFDPVLLAETERNLRLLDSLESVSVTASAPHGGIVDILVTTSDAWTTDVTGDFSNEGGRSTFTVDVSQKNLFGGGESLELLVDRDVERKTKAIEYRDPAVFGAYWNLDTMFANNSDGAEQRISIERPHFSYTTGWTAALAADHLQRIERLYEDGSILASFRQRHRALALSGSYAIRNEVQRTDSIIAGIDLTDDEFARVTGAIVPDARHLHFFDAGWESTGFSQRSLDYVDDSRVQDFDLGHRLSLHGALSSETWRVRASAGDGVAFGARSFLVGRITGSMRGDGNRIVSADGRAISRFGISYPETVVARVRADFGWRLDRDVQFFADGRNGLRAYPDFAFEGNRRVVANVEYRAYLGRDLLQLFSPGVAAFADAGFAGAARVKSDFGVGFRIGIPRYDAALIRIDYAYAPQRHRGVLSISTMQAF